MNSFLRSTLLQIFTENLKIVLLLLEEVTFCFVNIFDHLQRCLKMQFTVLTWVKEESI